MYPYLLKSESFLHPKHGEAFIAKLDKKYGVITKNKKVIVPFKYSSIYANRDFSFIHLRKNKNYTILDSNYRKVKNFKGIYWEEVYGDPDGKYAMLLKENTFTIFDLVRMKPVVKNWHKPSKEIQDTIENHLGLEGGVFAHTYWSKEGNSLIQIQNKNGQWAFYDMYGDLKYTPEYKSYIPLERITDYTTGHLFGYLQRVHSPGLYGSYDFNYYYKMNDDLIFEGLDSVSYIQLNEQKQRFIASDINGVQSEYRMDGSLIYEYIELILNRNKFGIVHKRNGYNIVDSLYNEVLEKDLKKISNYGALFAYVEQSNWYVIAVENGASISGPYERLQSVAPTIMLAYSTTEEGCFDVLDTSGNTTITDANNYKSSTSYFIIQDDKKEYWFTKSGILYASHLIE